MNNLLKNFILLVIVALFLLSCKKIFNFDATQNYLFKATFTNNWVQPDKKCIIFISDLDGNVLAEKTFSGNASFELNLNKKITKSLDDIEEINVTLVKEYNDYSITISTKMNVPVGSSWTWKGNYFSTDASLGRVNFYFQNVPNHAGFLFSSKWLTYYSFSSPLPSQNFFHLYETPTNIYLKLNTIDDGVKYKFFNNVVPGDREDDLSSINNAITKIIELDENSEYIKFLSGFQIPNHRSEGNYILDYGFDSYPNSNSIEIYYPENHFSDYRTSLYSFDINGNGTRYYYQSVYGDIPDEFIKINADFNFVNTTFDNFEISANGNFIETRTDWSNIYNDHWYVYSDRNTLKYKLPKLPDSVTQLFGLQRECFTLKTTTLINYPELKSYNEIMDILYKSGNYFYDVVNIVRLRQKECCSLKNVSVEKANKFLKYKAIEEDLFLYK